MIIYWLMFLIPILAANSMQAAAPSRDHVLLAICVFYTFLIGLRFQVGGDWETFLDRYDMSEGVLLIEGLSERDPLYFLMETISAALGWGIYGVNLACGAVLMAGVYYFCRVQPQPWLALAVAVPYLIIVVGMGYTRQSAAIGFELAALAALSNGKILRAVLLIAFASAFHRTAAVLFPLAFVARSFEGSWKAKILAAAGLAAMIGFIGWAVLDEESGLLVVNYVEAEMISEGANFRVAMNAVPAVILLLFYKKMLPNTIDRNVWILLALLSLACIVAVGFTSTATDRLALYLLPIQLFVYSRLGVNFASGWLAMSNASVVAVYAAALFVLLNYATIVSVYWVPYRFYE